MRFLVGPGLAGQGSLRSKGVGLALEDRGDVLAEACRM
jgi:hypothetical protein